MDDQQWFNRVALLIAVAVVVVGGTVLVVGEHNASASGSAPSSGAPATVDYLYLTIAFNPVNGMDEYFPANFTVPSNTLVVITITNYDNGTNLIAPQYSQVAGTVGGSATIWKDGSSTPQTYSSVAVTDVAHTFTINQGGLHLNVPVPPAGPTGLPTTVRFSAEFTTPGSFTWMCMAPCDPNSMATPGYMTGTLTVD